MVILLSAVAFWPGFPVIVGHPALTISVYEYTPNSSIIHAVLGPEALSPLSVTDILKFQDQTSLVVLVVLSQLPSPGACLN